MYQSIQVRVPRDIRKYLSFPKLPQKRSHQSINLSNSQIGKKGREKRRKGRKKTKGIVGKKKGKWKAK